MSICITTVQLSPHHVQHGEQDVPGLPYYRPPAPEGSSVRGNLLPLPSPRVQPFILNTSSSSLCAKHTPSSMERRTSPACDYRPCPRRRAVLCAAIYCRFHPHESNPSSLILPPHHFAQSTPHPAWSAGRPRPATTVRARAGGQFCARQ